MERSDCSLELWSYPIKEYLKKKKKKTSTLYSAPSYSRIKRRHCGCGGLKTLGARSMGEEKKEGKNNNNNNK